LYVHSPHDKGPRGAQAKEIIRKGVWNICKLLALSAPLCEVKGVSPKCWPVAADTHDFGCKGVSLGMEAANPFMKFLHDIVCVLAIKAF